MSRLGEQDVGHGIVATGRGAPQFRSVNCSVQGGLICSLSLGH
ncbi:hypothetical protein [Rummeliibacillus suwonensis]|nr:hypothetical protein [Rummeliibacillus suwonensis]